MIKEGWQTGVCLDYRFLFLIAIVKHALDHQLYSSLLELKKKYNLAILVRFHPPPQRYNSRLSNIYDSSRPLSLPKQHWLMSNNIQHPSTCPKEFSTLTQRPNPHVALLYSLSCNNNDFCFQLFLSIFAVKCRMILSSVLTRVCHSLDNR